LVEELAEVLARPLAAKRLAVIGRDAASVLRDYVEAVDFVTPVTIERVVISDPDDDVVIATAIAAQAALIVSGDQDLLAIKTYQGISILTAAQAIARIEAA
jgi:uncharacterized protein